METSSNMNSLSQKSLCKCLGFCSSYDRLIRNKLESLHIDFWDTLIFFCRLAKFKRELITPKSGGGGAGEGFDVAKTGDARIGFVGFPSVSEVSYSFIHEFVYSKVLI